MVQDIAQVIHQTKVYSVKDGLNCNTDNRLNQISDYCLYYSADYFEVCNVSLGYSSFIHQTKVYRVKDQQDYCTENRLNYKAEYYLYYSPEDFEVCSTDYKSGFS